MPPDFPILPVPQADPPAAAPAQGRPQPRRRLGVNLRGALWMLLSALGFACMGAVVKLLGSAEVQGAQPLDSLQITFFRALIGVLAVLPFIHMAGWRTAWPQYPVRHLGRAVTGLAAMVSGFYALTHLPLATATAISFAQPMFMIVLAVLFLGEPVRWRRWTATLVGFAGVLVMLRPGVSDIQPAMLAALGNALFVAMSAAQVKAMPGEERDLTLLLSFAGVSTLVLAVPAWMVWQPPTPEQWGLLILMGLLGVSSQAAVIRSYRVGAEATFVAPFDYVRLIFATGFGYALFAEMPDIWVFVGAVVVIGSAVYIARRGANAGRRGS